MSESIQHNPEQTQLRAEMVDAAWDFVRQSGNVVIKYPEGSFLENSSALVRAGKTSDGGAIIVHINQYAPPNLQYDPTRYSCDEYTSVGYITPTGEYTHATAVRRTDGATEWYPTHCDNVNSRINKYFMKRWRDTGGANVTLTGDATQAITDGQLAALTSAITSPETRIDPEATITARDYLIRTHGQPKEKNSQRPERSAFVRFVAECLDLRLY